MVGLHGGEAALCCRVWCARWEVDEGGMLWLVADAREECLSSFSSWLGWTFTPFKVSVSLLSTILSLQIYRLSGFIYCTSKITTKNISQPFEFRVHIIPYLDRIIFYYQYQIMCTQHLLWRSKKMGRWEIQSLHPSLMSIPIGLFPTWTKIPRVRFMMLYFHEQRQNRLMNPQK